MDSTIELAKQGTGLDLVHIVTFRLDRQIFAVPIDPVRQIIEMLTVTPVPQMKDNIEGVINFHGQVVPVAGLRSVLGMPKIPARLHTPIVLVTVCGRLTGLIVDEVLDVLTRQPEQVIRPRDILPEGLGDAPLLRGLIHSNEGMIILLDLDHLFVPQQARILAAAANVLNQNALAEQEIQPSKKGRRNGRKSQKVSQETKE